MITIRTAAPEELPQLRDLWRKCFGDPGAYVDIFFQKFCSIDQVLVVDDDGEVDSMAAMLPAPSNFPTGQRSPWGMFTPWPPTPICRARATPGSCCATPTIFFKNEGTKPWSWSPPPPPSIGSSRPWEWTSASPPCKVEILTSALSGDTGGGVMTPVSPREYNEIREGYLKNTFT